ncbi:hypothetical protein PACILC2_56570 [Paenibacillus cisolokensis]|mgnify:CR=1 FL=1|jgi:hypothetical protein|uniref:Uncharacterized protein n=1 Tax=Paenibacillus cisolokensis TaxID=1658519 RepID=A0ABQ4NFU4_9BACL|nr:hypothetical protein [Paenibacillus cisolokensis]GIQ67089.1 hypothetical protein PACILC2_56570 [Paenibacillus cisolokensis]
MDEYELTAIEVTRENVTTPLSFREGRIVVVTDLGTRFWYADIEGIEPKELLEALAASDNIRIALSAVTTDGRVLRGIGFMHPNVTRGSAAVRGDGELEGIG